MVGIGITGGMKRARKLSISIPGELADLLDAVAREEGVPRSRIVAEALRLYLGFRGERGSGEYPTVLWKLERSGGLRLRSPRFVGRRLKVKWVVEEA